MLFDFDSLISKQNRPVFVRVIEGNASNNRGVMYRQSGQARRWHLERAMDNRSSQLSYYWTKNRSSEE